MIVKQIRLQNFRLFEDVTMSFDDRLNVIVGVNGSGKSAFLEGIDFIFYRIYIAPMLGVIPEIAEKIYGQVQIGKINSVVKTLVIFEGQLFESNASVFKQDDNSWNGMPMKRTIILRSFEERITDADNLPLFVFYVADKDKGFINHKMLSNAHAQFAAFQNVFRNDNEAFYSFTNWFDTELNYENSIRLEKDIMYRSPKLQLVRRAFDIFLKAISGNAFKNLRIKLEPRKNFEPHNIVLIITKDGIDIPVDYLSAGEKSMILLVSDLVKRLFIANPSLENPLEGTGIVLIDEIDLHLHPKWQREVLPALLATFPNLQFIVTTHSPQVLSKIHKQHLFVLKDGQVKRPPSTYGKDTNLILNEVFDISERPDDIKKMLADCMQLLETDKIVEGKKLLAELTTLLGEDDPEIIHTTTYLNMFVE
jgi:predicted ATP-binding protein involved in virulence